MKRSHWSIPYAVFLGIFVVLPLLLILVYAFQDGQGHFTLANITRFFTDADALATPPVSLHFTLLFLLPITLFPQMSSPPTLVDLSLVCLIASKSLSITSVLISSWSLALSSSQAVPKWQLLP